MAASAETWIASPRKESFAYYLFSDYNKPASVGPWRPLTDVSTRAIVARSVLQSARTINVGQRCADLFCLRQFRLTGTIAGKVLMDSNNIRGILGLQERVLELPRPAELLQQLSASCFSSSR